MSLTAQQPELNIARVAIQALAAALGGTQSLHTDAFDEALALPTEKAARLALRTQQVVAYESGAATVADPLGGSHYVEWLTDEMERQAEAIFAKLDDWGRGSILDGVLAGIESNWFQSEIAEAAYLFQQQLATGRRTQVGVNRFTDTGTQVDGDGDVPLLAIGPEVEQAQCKRLAELRHHRSPAAVAEGLARVRAAAADPTANIMPAVIEAVRAYATIGEIMATMAEVFGRYVERAAL